MQLTECDKGALIAHFGAQRTRSATLLCDAGRREYENLIRECYVVRQRGGVAFSIPPAEPRRTQVSP